MSTTRNGGRGGAAPWARAAASREAVAPRKDSSASSRPVTTSGSCPRVAVTMSSKSVRLAASRVALVATMRTAVAPSSRAAAAYSASTIRVRSIASGASRPVASTPCPSRTTSIRRSRSVCAPGRRARRRRAGGWSWCRSRSPRPGSCAVLRTAGRRAGRPPLPHLRDRAVTDRVDARAGGQRVRGQRVQALDPVGHPAGASCGSGSTSRASRVAR